MAAENTPAEKIIDKIHRLEETGKIPYFSFEYFPPRTEDGVTNLYKRLERMAAQDPMFMDFTWGAGGSTCELTLELSINTKKQNDVDVNMHMTCTNQDDAKVDEGLEGAKAGNIRNICALRGDPPKGQEKWEAVAGGFECALDLVKHIRAKHGDWFGISVAGYPEGHPDNILPTSELGREMSETEKVRCSTDAEGVERVCSDEKYAGEMKYLKEKVDAGGEVIITQLFYDNETFFQFVRDCREYGINCPILPGIMPIQAYGGFKRMTGFCQTRVPAKIWEALDAIKEDDAAVKEYGIQLASDMCKEILNSGMGLNGVHFYCLNLEKSTFGVMKNLGLFKEAACAEAAPAKEEDTLKGTHIADPK